MSPVLKVLGRVLLAAVLLVAGTAHFVDTAEFLGQVPTFLPLREAIVLVSGVVELVLGVALLVLRGDRLATLGLVVAVFFVAVFPGNVWQAVHGSDSFGLDSTTSRVVRLFFQPLLVAWALWCTGAWAVLRGRVLRPSS
ncbi:DoxX family protein [Nocardioides rubriscoriae]|uniref:DoxX family protein n=1 Tax=Nocardioides rubriscoriae TaxID=642762 RepID=UPI0011DF60F7|nr:DoxX family membrane protein [Nocardioides rubriscoriae]